MECRQSKGWDVQILTTTTTPCCSCSMQTVKKVRRSSNNNNHHSMLLMFHCVPSTDIMNVMGIEWEHNDALNVGCIEKLGTKQLNNLRTFIQSCKSNKGFSLTSNKPINNYRTVTEEKPPLEIGCLFYLRKGSQFKRVRFRYVFGSFLCVRVWRYNKLLTFLMSGFICI
jgi:hypothetical protein